MCQITSTPNCNGLKTVPLIPPQPNKNQNCYQKLYVCLLKIRDLCLNASCKNQTVPKTKAENGSRIWSSDLSASLNCFCASKTTDDLQWSSEPRIISSTENSTLFISEPSRSPFLPSAWRQDKSSRVEGCWFKNRRGRAVISQGNSTIAHDCFFSPSQDYILWDERLIFFVLFETGSDMLILTTMKH